MNLFVTNSGFHHIAIQIFDYLTHQDLLQCRAVSADWLEFIDTTFWITRWKYLKKKSKRYPCNPLECDSLEYAFRCYQNKMKAFYNIAPNHEFHRDLASEFILTNLSVIRPVQNKFPRWKDAIEELSRSHDYIPADFFEEESPLIWAGS